MIPLVLSIFLLMGGCSKKGTEKPRPSTATDFLSFGFSSSHDTMNLTPYDHSISVHVSGTVTSGANLAPVFTLSPGATATVNNVPQLSGVTVNNFNNDLIYTVTAEDRTTQQTWTVQATNNDYSLPWGMGHFADKTTALDRSYDWYIDQMTTGTVAGYNCGPSSVTMAIKWADGSFSHSAAEARQTYPEDGGWWYTTDVANYLSLYSIPHAYVFLTTDADQSAQIMTTQLDNGAILICCIDMNYVRSSTSTSFRVDKFYPTTPAWGHFFVVKGYQWIDGQLYFQIYDPNSWGQVNSDNTLKGKDRFYRSADVAAATSKWWDYALVVGKKGQPLNTEIIRRAVSPASVPRAHSRANDPAVFQLH